MFSVCYCKSSDLMKFRNVASGMSDVRATLRFAIALQDLCCICEYISLRTCDLCNRNSKVAAARREQCHTLSNNNWIWDGQGELEQLERQGGEGKRKDNGGQTYTHCMENNLLELA